MKKCPGCGEEVVDVARFCPHCRYGFPEVTIEDKSNEKKSEKQKILKPSKKTAIVGCVLVILLLLLMLGIVDCSHKETKKLDAVAASCTEDGLTVGEICLKCDTVLIKQDVVPATGHDYVESTLKPMTCQNDGLVNCKCNVCGYEETKTVPAEHRYTGEPKIIQQATCISVGIYQYECLFCNQSKEKETARTEHVFIGDDCINCGSYKSPVEPNCWYQYNPYPALKVQNCEIAAFESTGAISMGVYYPVCQSCHVTLKETNVFVIRRGETQEETYNCSCGTETTIVLVLGN